EMPHGRRSQPVLVIRRRTPVSTANHEAVALSRPAMAGRAVDVEALLAARHHGVINRERKDVGVRAVQLAGVAQRVVAQLPARDGARDERPRRSVVAEESRLPERGVLRLVVHILTTGGTDQEWPQSHRDTEQTTILPPSHG